MSITFHHFHWDDLKTNLENFWDTSVFRYSLRQTWDVFPSDSKGMQKPLCFQGQPELYVGRTCLKKTETKIPFCVLCRAIRVGKRVTSRRFVLERIVVAMACIFGTSTSSAGQAAPSTGGWSEAMMWSYLLLFSLLSHSSSAWILWFATQLQGSDTQ